MIDELSYREREIICVFFGIKHPSVDLPIDKVGQIEAIEMVGEKYDLTNERIRQIKERAVRRMRKRSYKNDDLNLSRYFSIGSYNFFEREVNQTHC